jgi:CO/xanthine dehydrogenase FAD-binding subunit
MTLAVVNATSRVKVGAGGKCESVNIAVGAVAPTLVRIKPAEALLTGQALSDEAIEEAAEIAAKEISPIDDVHGTVWYRRKVTRVLVERTLREAANMNGGNS